MTVPADACDPAPSFVIRRRHDALGGPLLWSVPHAGRDYRGVDRWARGGLCALRPLEDRQVDRLIAEAVGAGQSAIIATLARAVIDLNRGEADFDPREVAVEGGGPSRRASLGLSLHRPVRRPASSRQSGWQPSARARAGLGLVPTRLGTAGPLWTRPPSEHEVTERIRQSHRPYHDAIGAALENGRAQHGAAVLLDLHSMPTLGAGTRAVSTRPVDVVLGDRHGASAGGWLTTLVAGHFRAMGLTVAINHPYPGGEITRRHGRPAHDIHALQIELDRRLYLAEGMVNQQAARTLGRGLAELGASVIDAIARDALPQAAE